MHSSVTTNYAIKLDIKVKALNEVKSSIMVVCICDVRTRIKLWDDLEGGRGQSGRVSSMKFPPCMQKRWHTHTRFLDNPYHTESNKLFMISGNLFSQTRVVFHHLITDHIHLYFELV